MTTPDVLDTLLAKRRSLALLPLSPSPQTR
jgi:hypothetical protein